MITIETTVSRDGAVISHHITEIPDANTRATKESSTTTGPFPGLPLRQQVYMAVESNPGVRAAVIALILGAEFDAEGKIVKNDQGHVVDSGKVNKDSVSQILTELKKDGLVANGVGEYNSWEWTVTDKIPPWEEQG